MPTGKASEGIMDYFKTASPVDYDLLKKHADEHRNNPTEAESALSIRLKPVESAFEISELTESVAATTLSTLLSKSYKHPLSYRILYMGLFLYEYYEKLCTS